MQPGVFADNSIILQCPKVGHPGWEDAQLQSTALPCKLEDRSYSSRYHVGYRGRSQVWGWRDGSAVGRLRLHTVLVEALSLVPSIHSSQLPITSGPGDLTPSFGLCWQLHSVYKHTDICTKHKSMHECISKYTYYKYTYIYQNTQYMHIKNKINLQKNLKVLLKISVLRNLRQADRWGSLTGSLAHIADSGLRRQPCYMLDGGLQNKQ